MKQPKFYWRPVMNKQQTKKTQTRKQKPDEAHQDMTKLDTDLKNREENLIAIVIDKNNKRVTKII